MVKRKICPECDGEGVVFVDPDEDRDYAPVKARCGKCLGRGEVSVENEKR